MSEENNYGSGSIKVLKGLEAVRKRPGMYIGDTDDGSGLHHMVFEVVDNSIDEALAKYCDCINVKIHSDGSVSVRDNGRGIPVDIHPEEGVSAAEVVMTVLHAGGKFDQNSYKVSGGLHGVGVSVVNALSDKLLLTIRRQGHVWQQTYLDGGHPAGPLTIIGDTEETGTEVRFWPSPSIFSDTVFKFEILERRLRELSFLNSGVKIVLSDERDNKNECFHYEGGIIEFIKYLNKGKPALSPDSIFYCTQLKEDDGIKVEIALQWVDTYNESIFCFTNNIPQKDGGTHKEGFRRAIGNAVSSYIKNEGMDKKKKIEINNDDCREGVSAVVSVKVPDPKFSSQTKDKLVSSEVAKAVYAIVNDKFSEFLSENPEPAKLIAEKVLQAAITREAVRKARETSRKKTVSSLPGKLSDCVNKDPAVRELYIVEGDSAGGSAKNGREAEFQAILPLRGKILNVERTRFDKMLNSETIGTLITALGCGIGKDVYNPDNFRYHKVVIMTDADVDGAHIRILLLTFFYRQMPEIIERGYVYIAQPPLYKYSHKDSKQEKYILDENEKNEYETTLALSNAQLFVNSQTAPIQGEQLEKVFLKYVRIFSLLHRLDRKIPIVITKELMFVDAITEDMLGVESTVKEWCGKLNQRFALLATPGMSYNVKVERDSVRGLYLPRVFISHFGVTHSYLLSYEFIVGQDYVQILKVQQDVFGLLESDAYLMIKGKSYKNLKDFGHVHDILMEEAMRGVTVQRYKGLGEMNPSQLYETTMSPENRMFLKVTIDDAIEADKAFCDLMGEDVAPRKVFIAENSHLAEIDS